MKWQIDLVKKMFSVRMCNEEYVRKADVIELLSRRCGGCKWYVEGDKKSLCKCISPTHHYMDGWRWTTHTQNACQKWERV